MFEIRSVDLISPAEEIDLMIYEFDRPTSQNLGVGGFSYCSGPHGPVPVVGELLAS